MHVPLTPLEFKLRAANLYANKVGIVDGRSRFTYAQLDERSNRLANALGGLIDSPQDQVASLLCPNTHHLMEGYYGIIQAGMIYNPLNPRFNPEALVDILGQSQSPVLIFHSSVLDVVSSLRSKLPFIKHYAIIEPDFPVDWAVDYEEMLADASPDFQFDMDAVDEESTAELFFTFGAHGSFRGAALTHRGLYLHALAEIISFELTDRDVLLTPIPISDGNGWGAPHSVPGAGARLVLLRESSVNSIKMAIYEEKVTRMFTVPALLNALLHDPEIDSFDFSSLKRVVVSGAAYSRELIEEAEQKLDCRVEGAYGRQETSPLISYARPNSSFDDDRRLEAQCSAGVPIMGVRLRIVNDDNKDVPRDGKTEGEVLVRSNTVMQGYHQRESLTKEVLVDGWYQTGDLATIDSDGYITIVGEKSRR